MFGLGAFAACAHAPLLHPRRLSLEKRIRERLLLNFSAGKHDDQVDALGLIGQLLDRMGKGTALPGPDQKIRFMNEMTMDEVWQLARPKRPDWDRRI